MGKTFSGGKVAPKAPLPALNTERVLDAIPRHYRGVPRKQNKGITTEKLHATLRGKYAFDRAGLDAMLERLHHEGRIVNDLFPTDLGFERSWGRVR